jgi:DNA-binding response OmpR family regulator
MRSDEGVTPFEGAVTNTGAAGTPPVRPRMESAVTQVQEDRADPLVLDFMLPGIDGLEVCLRLSTRDDDRPVILVTGPDPVIGRGVERQSTLDDHVVRPFGPREVVLRVGPSLRRPGEREIGQVRNAVTDGDLVVDSIEHTATLAGRRVSLTVREFDLLRFLVSHPGEAFSRDELLEHVWGWTYGDRSTVTVHVRRLREKIEANPSRPERLATVWGIGYRWEAAS